MVLIDRGISVEQFDYWCVAGELAILRLLTSLETSLGEPPAAQLIVDRGPDGDGAFSSAPSCGGALERRLLSGGGNGNQLLWSARFAVPVTILEGAQATGYVQAYIRR